MPRVAIIIAVLMPWICSVARSDSSAADPSMDFEEANAVFDVLQAINYEIDWRAFFPGDNPCTGGPHGVNCDLDNDTLHVVELNLGWVSDIVNNPPCAANASIHPSILKFRHLRKLFFYQCFVGLPMMIPEEITQLGSSLVHLTFQDNSALVGRIPESIANLTNLERLVLTENALEGAIPESIGGLKSLKQLVLSHNRIRGSIPAALGHLDSLMILDLSGNELAGSLPDEVGLLQNLEKLDLSANRLEGILPESIGNGRNQLRFLDLSYNNLSGGIPDSFAALSVLQGLFLRGNPLLGGIVPGFLGNLSSLEMLALSSSGFGGSIPDSLGGLLKLNSLALDGNELTGTIPSSIGRLRSLYHLNLSSNRLTGPLPFSHEVLNRLGRNLALKNNSGLCHVEEDLGDLDSVLQFGIEKCVNLGGLDSASQQQTVASSSSSAGKSSTTSAFALVSVVLSLVA